MINDNYTYSELTGKITGCAMIVHNKLKNGLPERYYHRAMEIECKEQGLSTRTEVEISVFYKEIHIGKRYCDMIIDNKVMLEFKATSFLEPIHLVQSLS